MSRVGWYLLGLLPVLAFLGFLSWRAAMHNIGVSGYEPRSVWTPVLTPPLCAWFIWCYLKSESNDVHSTEPDEDPNEAEETGVFS